MAMKCPACQADVAGAIPEDRFKEVVAKRNEFEAANKLLEPNAARAAALEADLAAARSKHAADVALLGAGINDADVRSYAESYYNGSLTAPEGGAKPSIQEWVAGWKATPESIPPLLRPHVVPTAAAAPTGTPAALPAGSPPPKVQAGTAPPSAATSGPASMQPGTLRNIRLTQGVEATKAHIEQAIANLGINKAGG